MNPCASSSEEAISSVTNPKVTMNLCHHQLSALLIASTLLLAVSFTHERPAWIHSYRTTDSRVFLAHNHADESPTDERQISQWDRRSVMESFVVGAIALSSTASTSSSSVSAITLPYDLDCLLDLPPVADDSVRIYLCRHAQTENNRLRLVQGARVDPPINYNGIQQSLRLGSALSRLKERCPQKILHSNLVRSKETAEFAARNIILGDKPVEVVMLPALAEVDFGPIADGQPVSDARGGMVRVVSAWVSGDIDMRPEGGGESGREVSVCVAFEDTRRKRKRCIGKGNLTSSLLYIRRY